METSDARKRRIEEARADAPFGVGDRVVQVETGRAGRILTSGRAWSYVKFDGDDPAARSIWNYDLHKETSDEALAALREKLTRENEEWRRSGTFYDSGVETPVYGFDGSRNGQLQKMDDPYRNVRKYDPVSSPEHYTHSKIEVWDAIAEWGLGYRLGNVIKYVARADRKGNPLQDLKKALAYLTKEIEARS